MPSPVERPLIVLPAPASIPSPTPPKGGRNLHLPGKARQVERLEPAFAALQQVFRARRATLQDDPSGAVPEEVLVLETIGSVDEFYSAVLAVRGLEWLVDQETRDVAPDGDFFYKHRKTRQRVEKLLAGRVYLVLANQEAIDSLLSMWGLWKRRKLGGKATKPWRDLFAHLRDVRRWGVEDRLSETRVLDDWHERIKTGAETLITEIELWFRAQAEQRRAETRVRRFVEAVGGQTIQSLVLQEISYHALLVRLPIRAVERVLDDRGVELVHCEAVRLFRAAGQVGYRASQGDPPTESIETRAPMDLGPPVAALLDGLPLENHVRLQDRLVVDDPDGWAEEYPGRAREHGTAMASLILHGDLSAGEAPLTRRLYVRPIMRPDPSSLAMGQFREAVPADTLWVDLVHRAVRRLVVGEGAEGPAAPNVCVVNFSLGDNYQPFIESVSPMAKLLDWLSWEHKLLFVVSAGNHGGDMEIDADPRAELTDRERELLTLKAVLKGARHRRILAPAESLNALTVGALHDDRSGAWPRRASDECCLLSTPGLPNVSSALGRGYRRAVKPDLLAPGGRQVFRPHPVSGERLVFQQQDRALFAPGQKVASPGPAGGNNGVLYTSGTSNAAALTCRASIQLSDALDALTEDPANAQLGRVPRALWIKALLAHGAAWSRDARTVLREALGREEGPNFRDDVAAILGYGPFDPSRVGSCDIERATLIGGGELTDGESHVHQVPLPPALNAYAAWRRLTLTLAWFSPINPNHHAYRRARLWFEPPAQPLDLTRRQAHHQAVTRGTLQHEVLEGDQSAVIVADGSMLDIPVRCSASAGGLEARIPYVLAVTVEVAPGVGIPVYDQVRQRIRDRLRVTVRT